MTGTPRLAVRSCAFAVALLELEPMRPLWHGRVDNRSGAAMPGFVQYGTPADVTHSVFVPEPDVD